MHCFEADRGRPQHYTVEDGPGTARPVRRAVRPQREPDLPLHLLPRAAALRGRGALPGNVPDALEDLGTLRSEGRIRLLGLRHLPQPRPESSPEAEEPAL